MDLAKIRKKLRPSRKESEKRSSEIVVSEGDVFTEWPERETTSERYIELLLFRSGAEGFAMEVSEVQEVIKPRPITPVPLTPPFVMGIISLRGKVIPVLDLAVRLKIEDKTGPFEEQKYHRIIIVKGPKGPAGLFAERVLEIVSIEENEMRPPPPSLSEEDARFIKGVVIYRGHLYSILNIQETFTFDGRMDI